jgi:hypothetical protein
VSVVPHDAAPIISQDLVVAADHGQIYIYSAALPPPDAGNPYLYALADAVDSGRFVGTCRALIDLMTPGQWNWHTPVRVEVWAGEPPADTDGWDHEADVDLDVPDGRLFLEASGGATHPWPPTSHPGTTGYACPAAVSPPAVRPAPTVTIPTACAYGPPATLRRRCCASVGQDGKPTGNFRSPAGPGRQPTTTPERTGSNLTAAGH